MDQLKTILIAELNEYATVGLNGRSDLTVNADETLFSIISTGQLGEKRFTFTSMIVGFLDNKIVIEVDKNDKLLVDALIQAGIPREQIILAYAGEKVPETLT